MNNIMIFDTETTGVPKNYKAAMTDVDNWPRVIQLAWLVCDLEANTLKTHEILIRPNGWEIPKEEFWIRNGFDTDLSLRDGQPLEAVMANFVQDLQTCEWMVAHNLAFDHPILGAEMIRLGMKSERKAQKICTMETTVDLCAIPFAGQRAWMSKKEKKYKWPKLQELHFFLFGRDFSGAHQAGADVAAVKVCLFELIRRGIITLTPAA
jgi:DNA polymerase III epsilon subunit-like protein